jgi:Na+/H+ antiporter NhaD/arsenite permease-like protein
MTPSVLRLTNRLGLKPVPYLLALATASNIGSVATITGNPQNMLIGSVSHISYLHFLARLGPIAAAGLCVDGLLVYLMYLRPAGGAAEPGIGATSDFQRHSSKVKPVIVPAAVLLGFLAGAPAAMVAAIGAAVLLITRTTEPRLVYDEVDWGLLVFFVGLFIHCGRCRASRTDRAPAAAFCRLEPAAHLDVRDGDRGIVECSQQIPAVELLKSLIPGFPDPQASWLTLAMASPLAGNLTITGSVANIIVVERARPEVPIGFREYFRLGLPLTRQGLRP